MLRLGEQTLRRGYARRLAENLLVKNVRDALISSGIGGRVHYKFTRVYVEVNSSKSEDAQRVLSRVFGVSSFSPVIEVGFQSLEDLAEKVVKIAAGKVKGKSFAVRPRRAGYHPFTSLDMAKVIGEQLLKYGSRVDLKNPEVEVNVEVRGWNAYIFYEKIPGAGGLPIGVESPALALVSGGFDSAVAAWYVLRRGVPVHYVFFNLGGDPHFYGMLSVVKVLADDWSYGYSPKLYEVDFRDVVRMLIRSVEEPYWNIVLKRMMYRAAERIALTVGAEALVTGENIGQVSSQTVTALKVASTGVKLPIFRPLLGFDKNEIIKMSMKIGTYKYSEMIPEYCALVPKAPVARPTLEEVLEEERKLDLKLIDEIASQPTVYSLREISKPDLTREFIEIEEVPEDAVLVDIRSREDYEEWHIPNAIHIDDLKPEPGKKYVFYCTRGKSSRLVAAYYKWKGFESYSLKGGIQKLKPHESIDND